MHEFDAFEGDMFVLTLELMRCWRLKTCRGPNLHLANLNHIERASPTETRQKLPAWEDGVNLGNMGSARFPRGVKSEDPSLPNARTTCDSIGPDIVSM